MEKRLIYHSGIKGQKWGVRRYQNPDGSLTDAGRRRYRKHEARSYQKKLRKLDTELQKTTIAGNVSAVKANKYAVKGLDIIKKQTQKGFEKGLSMEEINKQINDPKNRKTEKAKDYIEKSNLYRQQTAIIQKHQNAMISDMENTVRELRNKGYSYKVTKTNFNQPLSYRSIKNVIKDNGMKKMMNIYNTGWLNDDVNASSGNRITVRDSSRLSDNRRRKWEDKHSQAQSYRGQRVVRTRTYRYY